MRSQESTSGFPVLEFGRRGALTSQSSPPPSPGLAALAQYLVVLMAEQIRKNFQHQTCYLGTHVLPFRKKSETKHDMSKCRSTVSSQADLNTNLGSSAYELRDPG